MNKIDMLLVYPKPTSDSPVKLTPLSILYPGAMFESQGKTVAYFDERYDPPEMLDDQLVCAADSPLDQVIGREALERYESALARLTIGEREAIIARVELEGRVLVLYEAGTKLEAPTRVRPKAKERR